MNAKRDHMLVIQVSENDNDLKKIVYLAKYEERGGKLFIQMSGVPTSESVTPTSNRIVESLIHTRMEVGGVLHGFHNRVTKDTTST